METDEVTSSIDPEPASDPKEEDDAKMSGGEEEPKAEEVVTDEKKDDGLEEDEARPEATFRFVVENFSTVKESVLSPPCMVRNLPWKIMIMPRSGQQQQERGGGGGQGQQQKSMGYFLQCNGESEASSWSCQAQAELRVLSVNPEKETFRRKISHLFYAKENDWGFSHYMSWNDVMDEDRGLIKNDTVTFEVHVTADAPHGVCWDSKKHTGYVGLKNQGATCYLNSMLQVLYFTNALRKAVYKMPTEADDSAKSVGLALQRVFNDLQFNDKAVGTKKLTKSFGWETLDSFMQHDVQEFLRVLLDKLEMKMKATCVEGTIPRLFEGKTTSFFKCKNVDYSSHKSESFYDVQLNIKGKKDLAESFREYIKTETLDGENKYDAGSYGLQDAVKGILFKSFPPILHLHLLRFHYDPATDGTVKCNDRFEFPSELDLSEFLSDEPDKKNNSSNGNNGDEAMEVDEDDDGTKARVNNSNKGGSKADLTTYVLHAVLVHSGDNHGGHYVVFINPRGDGKWCKFDDDVVSRCTETEAIRNNFGGTDDEVSARHSTNAYMLVYIRKSSLRDILCEVRESDIPEALTERLMDERKLEAARRKEKQEAYLYMTVRILTEDQFVGHQGNDLYDPEKVVYHEFRVRKADTLREMIGQLSEQMKHPPNQMRVWPMNHRTNQTLRPTLVDMEQDLDKSVIEVADNIVPWTIFLELAAACPSDLPAVPRELAPFDKDQDVMLFLKYYDPAAEKIHYVGHMYISITAKLSSIMPELTRRAYLPADTRLTLFEEIKPNMLERIDEMNKPLEHVLEELMDGDIIVYQKEVDTTDSPYRLPACRDYFRDLYYKVDVTFVDKNLPGDPGFTLTLSQRMNYTQFSTAAAEKLDVEPDRLQFFKCQNYREIPGHSLRCTYEGTLKELLVCVRPKQPKKLFYQRLSIPIHDLENKRQVRCLWVSRDGKEEKELTLYPNKNGTVADLLAEARPQVTLSSPDAQLRLLDVTSHKITGVNEAEARIDSLSISQSKSFRVEEVPNDQRVVGESDLLVAVAHFQKEIYSTFGHPFLLKITEGESFESVKEKIQRQLDVPDKEFEKYRIALITVGRPKYLEDFQQDSVRLRDFMQGGGAGGGGARPYIGLEHVNKNSKRARYNYMEKGIKIYD